MKKNSPDNISILETQNFADSWWIKPNVQKLVFVSGMFIMYFVILVT
jgi:hypothetical protein